MRSFLPRLRPLAGLQAVGGRCRVFTILAGLIGLGLVPASGAAASPVSAPDLHTFTNQSGKTIQAAITDATLDNVSLKRDDGQLFKVPLGMLSKDDQDYISQWVVRRAKAQGSDIFKFEAVSERGTTPVNVPNSNEKRTVQATNGKTGRPTIKGWSESYNIKITNVVPAHLAKLQLRYIIFSMSAVPGGLAPNDYTPSAMVGKAVAVDDLPAGTDQTVATGSITLSEYSAPLNFTYTNGAPLNITDQLKGIWVRVYDENNNLLQEWASLPTLIKENNWDDLIRQASAAAAQRGGFGGGGGGAGGGRRGG